MGGAARGDAAAARPGTLTAMTQHPIWLQRPLAMPTESADQAVAGQARPRGLAAPHYLYANDQPHLFYRSAWSGFDTWSYDFSTGHWVFQPD